MSNTCDSPTPVQRKAGGASGENVNVAANRLAVALANGASVQQCGRARLRTACPVPQRVQSLGRKGTARNRPVTFGPLVATPVTVWRKIMVAIAEVAPV